MYAAIPGRFADDFNKYFARGIAATGLTNNAGFYWEDFTACGTTAPNGWIAGHSGTGAFSRLLAGTKGGLIQLTSGGTANGIGEVYTENNIVSSALTDRFYYATKFSVTTTIDAETRCFNGLYATAGTANAVTLGAVGPISATKYVILYDGNYSSSTTGLTSTVSVDTASHIGEAYCQGDNVLRGRFDDEAELSATQSSTATGAYAVIASARNQATGAVRTLRIDWVLCIFPR